MVLGDPEEERQRKLHKVQAEISHHGLNYFVTSLEVQVKRKRNSRQLEFRYIATFRSRAGRTMSLNVADAAVAVIRTAAEMAGNTELAQHAQGKRYAWCAAAMAAEQGGAAAADGDSDGDYDDVAEAAQLAGGSGAASPAMPATPAHAGPVRAAAAAAAAAAGPSTPAAAGSSELTELLAELRGLPAAQLVRMRLDNLRDWHKEQAKLKRMQLQIEAKTRDAGREYDRVVRPLQPLLRRTGGSPFLPSSLPATLESNRAAALAAANAEARRDMQPALEAAQAACEAAAARHAALTCAIDSRPDALLLLAQSQSQRSSLAAALQRCVSALLQLLGMISVALLLRALWAARTLALGGLWLGRRLLGATWRAIHRAARGVPAQPSAALSTAAARTAATTAAAAFDATTRFLGLVSSCRRYYAGQPGAAPAAAALCELVVAASRLVQARHGAQHESETGLRDQVLRLLLGLVLSAEATCDNQRLLCKELPLGGGRADLVLLDARGASALLVVEFKLLSSNQARARREDDTLQLKRYLRDPQAARSEGLLITFDKALPAGLSALRLSRTTNRVAWASLFQDDPAVAPQFSALPLTHLECDAFLVAACDAVCAHFGVVP